MKQTQKLNCFKTAFGFMVFIVFSSCIATAADTSKAMEILNRYTKNAGSQVGVKMTTEKKSLGTKTISRGIVSVANGKVNISLDGEKKSEMIYDGNRVTLISYPDLELDPNGKRKVIQIKSKGKNHLNLVSLLFTNPKKFFGSFKTTQKNIGLGDFALTLTDKKSELKPMTLEFSSENESLKKISYADDVDTEIIIELEKPKFPKAMPKNLFKYVKKKNDEEIVE